MKTDHLFYVRSLGWGKQKMRTLHHYQLLWGIRKDPKDDRRPEAEKCGSGPRSPRLQRSIHLFPVLTAKDFDHLGRTFDKVSHGVLVGKMWTEMTSWLVTLWLWPEWGTLEGTSPRRILSASHRHLVQVSIFTTELMRMSTICWLR